MSNELVETAARLQVTADPAPIIATAETAVAEAPQLAAARFLFNRPLAISRLGFKQLADNLLLSLRTEAPTLRAMLGMPMPDDVPDDPYDVDPTSGVATIEVHGALVKSAESIWAQLCGCPSYEGLGAAFAQALGDPSVKSIVFDIDSPGGEIEGCFDLADQIYSARGTKPIAALVNENAFSAAYAIASAADRIYVPRTGGVGSIGVICEHWDYSGLLEQMGIKVTAIYAGDHKNDGSPFEPLSTEAKASIQGHVDTMNGLFVSTVARNRAMSAEKVQGTQAAIYFGVSGALESGLADVVASPAEAMALVSMAKPGTSPITMLEGQLAASRAETAEARATAETRAGEARAEVWKHVGNVIARCRTVRHADFAVVLLEENVTAEAVGDRLAEMIVAAQSPAIVNVNGDGNGRGTIAAAAIKWAVEAVNQRR
jgi:signal peptide peptidase SppA